MIILEDKIIKLLQSRVVEDVVLGFSMINHKYGWQYWGQYLIPDDDGNYYGQCPVKLNTNNYYILIKVIDYGFIIHLLLDNADLNTYKPEYKDIVPGKYGDFTVYEI